jgi:hypothetical protein
MLRNILIKVQQSRTFKRENWCCSGTKKKRIHQCIQNLRHSGLGLTSLKKYGFQLIHDERYEGKYVNVSCQWETPEKFLFLEYSLLYIIFIFCISLPFQLHFPKDKTSGHDDSGFLTTRRGLSSHSWSQLLNPFCSSPFLSIFPFSFPTFSLPLL